MAAMRPKAKLITKVKQTRRKPRVRERGSHSSSDMAVLSEISKSSKKHLFEQ